MITEQVIWTVVGCMVIQLALTAILYRHLSSKQESLRHKVLSKLSSLEIEIGALTHTVKEGAERQRDRNMRSIDEWAQIWKILAEYADRIRKLEQQRGGRYVKSWWRDANGDSYVVQHEGEHDIHLRKWIVDPPLTQLPRMASTTVSHPKKDWPGSFVPCDPPLEYREEDQ